MRTKVIISMMLILLILFTFSGLVGAQVVIESPTYVPPPPGPPPGTPPSTTPPSFPPPGEDGISTPSTGGGLATGATMLFGLLLVSAALPLKRR